MSDLGAFAELFMPAVQGERCYGAVVALVTNNQDPDKLGRVKLKFPWMSDQDESDWARVLTPMAGKDRGLFCLPEVDDEVLVAFEQGDMRRPYVLGALWNGTDTPPATNDDGKNNRRIIVSRSGLTILLDDEQGKEKIEIRDKNGKNKIVIAVADNTVTIAADANITITASQGKLKLSGNGIELASQGAVKVQAQSSVSLEASGQMTIKGATVDIN